jgi:hypothetical protein
MFHLALDGPGLERPLRFHRSRDAHR